MKSLEGGHHRKVLETTAHADGESAVVETDHALDPEAEVLRIVTEQFAGDRGAYQDELVASTDRILAMLEQNRHRREAG